MTEPDALEQLARRLWDERRIVTYLLFKLTVAKLLLSADERRFVPAALDEVDRTVELLRDGEHRRDEAVRDLAELWSMDPLDLTLDELARRAPEPYGFSFAEHRQAFTELTAEIETVARENRALARTEFEHVARTIDEITGGPTVASTTYDASGQLDTGTHVGTRLREVL